VTEISLRRRGLLAAGLAAGAVLPRPAFAQGAAAAWPDRPVRMIIPWPPGGGNDIVGRIVADRLGHALGKPVVAENRGGSNGVMGAEMVAKARPDGYTLMFHSVTSHVVNPAIFPRLPYDTDRDFIPVAVPGQTPLAVQVNLRLPINTMSDLVTHAREHPGRLSYGSFGNGSGAHLAGEMLKQRLGLDIVHVPYRGGAPALSDTISGVLPMNIGGVNTTNAAIRAGLIRTLAVTSSRRSSFIPDIPTVEETMRLADFDVAVVSGLWAPTGTPEHIVDRLADEMAAMMRDPAMQPRLMEAGVEPLPPMDARQRATFVAAQGEVLRRVVREARITLE
jgi:tripartite-type tricarboxylate transporter receptor subunit TctC